MNEVVYILYMTAISASPTTGVPVGEHYKTLPLSYSGSVRVCLEAGPDAMASIFNEMGDDLALYYDCLEANYKTVVSLGLENREIVW